LIHVRKRLEILFGLSTFLRFFENEELTLNKFLQESDTFPVPRVKEGVIATEVLRILDLPWVSVADTEIITTKMGIPDELLGVRIYALNQILETYKKIPDQYYKENDHRVNVFEAVQEALDDVIEQEEAEEDDYENDDEQDDDDIDLDFDF